MGVEDICIERDDPALIQQKCLAALPSYFILLKLSVLPDNEVVYHIGSYIDTDNRTLKLHV